MHDDERYLFEALKAGAGGYVLKKEADQFLVDAVRAVVRGEPFLTNAAQRALVREWMADDSAGPGRAADAARAGGPQADRRGPHQPRDRRDPAPRREDRRVPPRQPAAQAGHARSRRARALRDPPRADRAVAPADARPDVHLSDGASLGVVSEQQEHPEGAVAAQEPAGEPRGRPRRRADPPPRRSRTAPPAAAPEPEPVRGAAAEPPRRGAGRRASARRRRRRAAVGPKILGVAKEQTLPVVKKRLQEKPKREPLPWPELRAAVAATRDDLDDRRAQGALPRLPGEAARRGHRERPRLPEGRAAPRLPARRQAAGPRRRTPRAG